MLDIEVLVGMSSEALGALDEHERTGKSDDVFNKIRALGDICIEGSELHPYLKSKLDIRRQYDFKNAALTARGLRSLTSGRGKNPVLMNYLCLIKSELEGVIERDKEEGVKKVEAPNISENTNSNKVFIVHGHDEHAKIETARFIEKAGLEAIILHEQPSGSKTIIEKIESFGDVGFAVILYTPCDLGVKKSDEPAFNNRARQNVVFEHGYFIGRLGRSKVAALVKGEIETPNDISGVVYTEIDAHGAWKVTLLKELKAAGYQVDGNALI